MPAFGTSIQEFKFAVLGATTPSISMARVPLTYAGNLLRRSFYGAMTPGNEDLHALH